MTDAQFSLYCDLRLALYLGAKLALRNATMWAFYDYERYDRAWEFIAAFRDTDLMSAMRNESFR